MLRPFIHKFEPDNALACRPKTILCSFGDMLRVPGSKSSLLEVKSEYQSVRIVYSPLDALKIARENLDCEIVFFAVGFETTAPAHAMAIHQAYQEGIQNLSFLVSQVLVPPAMEVILSAKDNRVQGFLAAGHVCTVMGYTEYEPIATKYHIPIVVTGFEPLDLLEGIFLCIKLLEEGKAQVANPYRRSVRREGNLAAQTLIHQVFEVVPRKWRGIGEIPQSGLGIRSAYAHLDAEKRFDLSHQSIQESDECISGSILQGIKKPYECSAFGTRCRPEHPLGAPMVSSEGACAAYFHYTLHRYKKFLPHF